MSGVLSLEVTCDGRGDGVDVVIRVDAHCCELVGYVDRNVAAVHGFVESTAHEDVRVTEAVFFKCLEKVATEAISHAVICTHAQNLAARLDEVIDNLADCNRRA